MPTEKAHGIQIAKMCEAFVEAGIDLTLLVPNRKTERKSIKEYYNLRVPIKLKCLPAIDWYTGGRLGYFISSISFIISYLFFLFWKKIKKEKYIIYTVDIDNYSSSLFTFLHMPLFSEMHGGKSKTFATNLLFKGVDGIITINKIIAKELQNNFPNPKTRYLIEPNGVDLSYFDKKYKKEDARKKFGLPQNVPMVLYFGRFFEWKGLEIIPEVASHTPHIHWQMVGGTKEDFERLVKQPIPQNIFFAGGRPYSEMSTWLATADVLLVLGTSRDIQSFRYTSPMKIFEYMASSRLIIASDTPAIQEIVNDKEVLFYKHDNSKDLEIVLENAIKNQRELSPIIEMAMRHAERASWKARAERIFQFINKNIE